MGNADKILKILKREYPEVKTALHFGDVWQLLVAVILSAQCTDERVNKVTPELFKKLPKVEDFVKVKPETLEQLIYSTGFYMAKAKNIKGAAEKILKEFGGKVPGEMEDLLKLPGVARKTANVVLNAGFGKTEGMAVDTHVIRLSGRLGLADGKLVKVKNAVKIERELMKKLPKMEWGNFSHLLIFHGRKVCFARKPNCKKCKLNKICPSAFKI